MTVDEIAIALIASLVSFALIMTAAVALTNLVWCLTGHAVEALRFLIWGDEE